MSPMKDVLMMMTTLSKSNDYVIIYDDDDGDHYHDHHDDDDNDGDDDDDDTEDDDIDPQYPSIRLQPTTTIHQVLPPMLILSSRSVTYDYCCQMIYACI
jgi:hypothetical protein